jgi:hypothetical protein
MPNDEADRLRALLKEAADAMYPAIILFRALKLQGLGSRAHANAVKVYDKILEEVGNG